MTRDEFSSQLQKIVTQANEEHLALMRLWSALSEQCKLAELMLDIEIVRQYKRIRDEESEGPA